MKKSRIIIIICIIALLAAVCIGGLYLHTPRSPPMSGLEMVEYSEHIIYSDEPYTIVELTEEIHKENPELAVLIEKMNKTGFDRELGMTDDELSFSLHPDKYISIERGMELWNAYGYAEIFGDNKKEHIVLSENGKLYCLIKTNL
ncbi:MAG TPA: hypothetical protein O0X48_01665 [Methanocorpusculum sp.]|nr:hypothetical protein [Methanocorpusculum sp.]